jgi:hypothetical protein
MSSSNNIVYPQFDRLHRQPREAPTIIRERNVLFPIRSRLHSQELFITFHGERQRAWRFDYQVNGLDVQFYYIGRPKYLELMQGKRMPCFATIVEEQYWDYSRRVYVVLQPNGRATADGDPTMRLVPQSYHCNFVLYYEQYILPMEYDGKLIIMKRR